MSMGAVLLRTGTINGSQLGGLYKSMPWTTGFCIVGAASISAFPLFSGFVSKSLIITAAAENGHWITWTVLLFASAGVFHHSGIKIPYFAFFAHDSGIRVKEAPWNMLIAMAITAALCIGIGVYPAPLYAILPFVVDFEPYTTAHVITQLQLLMFSALAFSVLMRTGLYPPELPLINLDTDWIYRRALPVLVRSVVDVLTAVRRDLIAASIRLFDRFMVFVFHYHGPHGVLARSWPIGGAVIWVLVLLAGFLLIYYG
jgi:multicomponent Na+:H+ antiporter subunit D